MYDFSVFPVMVSECVVASGMCAFLFVSGMCKTSGMLFTVKASECAVASGMESSRSRLCVLR